MKKYKITCVDPRWVDKRCYGVDFVAIGYTDDDETANWFGDRGLSSGGVPLFTVEEIDE